MIMKFVIRYKREIEIVNFLNFLNINWITPIARGNKTVKRINGHSPSEKFPQDSSHPEYGICYKA